MRRESLRLVQSWVPRQLAAALDRWAREELIDRAAVVRQILAAAVRARAAQRPAPRRKP